MADQQRLLAGIQTLYNHCVESDIPWDKIERGDNGKFSTHDILKSLGLLEPIRNDDVNGEQQYEPFQEDTQVILRQFEEEDERRKQPHALKRKASSSSSSASSHSPVMFPPHEAPLSRSSSQGSMQGSPQYPMINRSRQPSYIPIPTFAPAPIGGPGPLTPAESPTKDRSVFQFGMDRVMGQMQNLSQSPFGLHLQNFNDTPQPSGMYSQTYDSFIGPQLQGHPLFNQMGLANPYVQDSNVFDGPLGVPSHSERASSDLKGPTLAPPPPPQQENATRVELSTGDQDPEQSWAAACLPTATDPLMGFLPSMVESSDEMMGDMGIDYNDL